MKIKENKRKTFEKIVLARIFGKFKGFQEEIMKKLVFIGSGMMASAMSIPANENGHEIRLVGSPLDDDIIEEGKKSAYHITLKRQLPKSTKFYYLSELDQALEGADAVICGVSSFGVDWILEEIFPKLDPELPIISVTKGMINDKEGNLLTYPEYWQEKLEEKGIKREICAVGGPCTSYELADHDDSLVCYCGENIDTVNFFKDIFETDYYHISTSTDVRAVELAVALKNAYALAVTLAVGLAEKREGIGAIHYNSQAALFTQAAREMQALLEFVNGSNNQIELGVGDLYVTVFGGRTRKIGTLLGRGLSFDQAMEELKGVTLESVVISQRMGEAINRLDDLGKIKREDYPLLMHVYDIIANGAEVDIPWKKFDREDIK